MLTARQRELKARHFLAHPEEISGLLKEKRFGKLDLLIVQGSVRTFGFPAVDRAFGAVTIEVHGERTNRAGRTHLRMVRGDNCRGSKGAAHAAGR